MYNNCLYLHVYARLLCNRFCCCCCYIQNCEGKIKGQELLPGTNSAEKLGGTQCWHTQVGLVVVAVDNKPSLKVYIGICCCWCACCLIDWCGGESSCAGWPRGSCSASPPRTGTPWHRDKDHKYRALLASSNIFHTKKKKHTIFSCSVTSKFCITS